MTSLSLIGQWATLRNVLRRFPMLYPLCYILLPYKVALSYFTAHKASKLLIRKRVSERHEKVSLDYISQFMKDEKALPPDDFLVAQAGHLILDHFESSSVLSAGIYFLTTNPEVMCKLQMELREAFNSLDDIKEEVLQNLPWLHAVIEEVLRIHTNVPYGLPRISPGIMIDGHYVPKGVSPPSSVSICISKSILVLMVLLLLDYNINMRLCNNSLPTVFQQTKRI
jgi:cytochrome P450